MITPEQRAELRRLRTALPPQPMAFVYFETLRQVCAVDGNPDNGLTHIADEPVINDTSAWLSYVAKAATLAPALLEALESAEARAAELEQRALASLLRERYNELSLLLASEASAPESVIYSRGQQMNAIRILLDQLEAAQ